ncbi:MAG TPA: hypothetical protein VM008_18135 [Phycisphaerae bacterium]|nr:hypothetical protein [Phycisphaerae bacterium]
MNRHCCQFRPSTLGQLLAATPNEINRCDIARMNLLCAQSLPRAERLDVEASLSQIDEWTEHVREETARFYPSYLRNPNPQKGSLAVFQLWAVIRSLKETYELKHHLLPKKRTGFKGYGTRAVFGSDIGYEDSRPLFIHGLLGPERIGSCSSLPVLFTAVARRLGYPVNLALAVQHMFNRWESPTETFNMDGSGPDYITRPPSEDFIDVPRPWTSEQKYCGCYLRSITAQEALAAFLLMRGACLQWNGDLREAHRMCALAHLLSPKHPAYAAHLEVIEDLTRRKGHLARAALIDNSCGKMPSRVPRIKRTFPLWLTRDGFLVNRAADYYVEKLA